MVGTINLSKKRRAVISAFLKRATVKRAVGQPQNLNSRNKCCSSLSSESHSRESMGQRLDRSLDSTKMSLLKNFLVATSPLHLQRLQNLKSMWRITMLNIIKPPICFQRLLAKTRQLNQIKPLIRNPVVTRSSKHLSPWRCMRSKRQAQMLSWPTARLSAWCPRVIAPLCRAPEAPSTAQKHI